jgi:hypothetical protein
VGILSKILYCTRGKKKEKERAQKFVDLNYSKSSKIVLPLIG